MLKLKIILILFGGTFAFFSLDAQTCCSAGAPITSSFAIGTSEARSLAFQLDYEYNSVNLLIDNNKRIENDPRSRNGQSLLYKTDFVLNQHWAFSAFIPLVIQNRTTISANERASGLGDLTLLGQYSFPFSQDGSFSISAGIKLPTGSQFITDERGINLSPDMQSGSGTLDYIGRIAFNKAHIFTNNLNLQTAFSYRYNTTNMNFGDPNGIAGRQFKFGNESQLSGIFSYSIFSPIGFWSPEMGLLFRHTSPNEEQGTNAPNSGGYWIRWPLGLAFRPDDRLSGEIPIFQQLDGLQITTDYKLGIQVRYQIALKEKMTPVILR